MNRITATGVATTNGNVEIATRDRNGQHAAIILTPAEAATLANAIAISAVDAGVDEPLIALRNIYRTTEVEGAITKRGNARLDWCREGHHHRLVIGNERVRDIADMLHDLADQLEDK
ncbi:hypothetical protein G6030_02360 [Dietzia sp. E1]|uniref:hypothetical protein n=1 Tax=Dietzia sp. E1 TaxID=328361 RepID=UPI0015F8A501|nr:hypothetical protein [Dietzia sp. E1]MBB1020145.1 hypothetical protein [Dietzia sp. E1]